MQLDINIKYNVKKNKINFENHTIISKFITRMPKQETVGIMKHSECPHLSQQ